MTQTRWMLILAIFLLAMLPLQARGDASREGQAWPDVDQFIYNSMLPEMNIARMRKLGPDVLVALGQRYDQLKQAGDASPGMLRQIERLMDGAAQQRYGHVSRLYWHTDWAEAVKDAQATGRPVLSLRLLGKLTDEYSCANSRFFRVILYADPAVSSYLRENYVLHWQEVRDVPQVTLTLADGSVMKRTVTGNSAHLVIHPWGQVVNIIPGLMHADAFLEELKQSHGLATRREFMVASALFPMRVVRQWHEQQRQAMHRTWDGHLAKLNLTRDDLQDQVLAKQLKDAEARYAAEQVMNRAMSKAITEASLIQPIRLVDVQMMWRRMNDANWQKFVASLQREPVRISPESIALIVHENGRDKAPAMIERLQQSLASDTAFNRYVLGDEIRRWFIAGVNDARSPDAVTSQLYRDILGMDLNDPWAGLQDDTVYTGLDHGGLFAPKPSSAVR